MFFDILIRNFYDSKYLKLFILNIIIIFLIIPFFLNNSIVAINKRYTQKLSKKYFIHFKIRII